MNNTISDLHNNFEGDKLLSPFGKMNMADKLELSLEERYVLQRKEMIDKFRNQTEEKLNIDTDRIAKDIVKEINKAFKK